MDKAVIYARVSSKEQEVGGYSIPAQRKFLQEYAAMNNFVVVKEFTDVETAKKAGRNQFNEMLDFVKKDRTVKNIFVEKTDRLLRNLFDLATIDQLITDFGVKIHLVKENRIQDKNSRSYDKFFFGLNALMAKQTVDNLSEEVKKGMREKAEQGVYPSRAPYGYLNESINGKKSIKLDPDAAPYVKKMFELYAAGTSIEKLRNQMLADGMVFRNGKNFYTSAVELILKNEFYTGMFYWDGFKCENASHPAIVSKELFYKVQGLLMNPNKSTKSRKGLFPYTNLIRCGLCGCYLTAEIKKEKYIYYHCSDSKGKCAQKSVYIKQSVLDAEFERALESIHITEEAKKLILQGLRESLQEKIEYHDHLVKQIELQIDVLQKRLNKAYTDHVDGKISEEFWREQTMGWAAEKEQLTMKLLTQQKTDTRFMENANLILELARKASGLFKTRNAEQKRRLVNLITSNCTLKDGKIVLELCEPYSKLMETKKSGKWWR